jgi:hypothetical protein
MNTDVKLDNQHPDSLEALQIMGIHYVVSTHSTPLSGKIPELKLIWSDDHANLFAVPGALPRYYTVGHSIPVASDDQTVSMFHSAAFDFRKSVLLANQRESGRSAGDAHDFDVQVIEETPTRILLRTNRPTPGWLVALQTYYPGWIATVNDQESAPVRANLAFTAVAVPAGIADVTLEYRPASVRVGLLISGLTAGLIAVLAAFAFLSGMLHVKNGSPGQESLCESVASRSSSPQVRLP